MTTTPTALPPAPGGGGLPLTTRAVVAAAGAAGALSRALGVGAGGTVPGRVVLALLSDPLRQLARGRRVLLVSGTNGKTTTTGLLAAALTTRGPVVTNSDGDNLVPGLVSTLARGARRPGPAVLEVDEAALPAAMAGLSPEVVLLLNLSRDQLDRHHEVAGHVQRWAAALRGAPATTVVANADDPLVVHTVLTARPGSDGVVWVAVGQPWRADCPRCPRCGSAWAAAAPAADAGGQSGPPPAGAGSWACGSCAFRRPPVTWAVTGDTVRTAGAAYTPALQLPGRVNVGNAAMAAAAAGRLGVDPEPALAAMRPLTTVSGRYLRTRLGGTGVSLLLAKNPAGWAEVLDQLADRTGAVVVAVNAQAADGADPSWLWDVPFERLRGRRVVAAGERAADVSVRLLYAGVAHTIEPDALRAVGALGVPACDIAANYTAFTRIRDRLTAADRAGRPA